MEPFERDVVSDLNDKSDFADKTDEARARQRMPLHVRILLGLVIGAGLGGGSRALLDSSRLTWIVNYVAEPVGQLFLRTLLMTVVPLVLSSLIVGVAGIGDVRRLGRVGAKTFAYTLVVSLISVALGLTLANTVRPGTRVDPATRDLLLAQFGSDATRQVQQSAAAVESPTLTFVRTLVPSNPIESMARPTPDMIGLMFFAIVFGAALTLLTPGSVAPVVSFLNGVFETVAKIIDIVMKFAPIGVGCLLFTMTARFGFGFLVSLGWFVVTVLVGLSIHMFVVYSLALRLLGRVSPVDFFRRVRTVMLTAFSTLSLIHI